MKTYLPLAAAAIVAVLGMLHLGYTLYDLFVRPRYFKPRDHAMLEAMRATTMSIAPTGRDYWTTLLGFHVTHSLALLLFALLIVLSVTTPLPALRPLLAAIALGLTLISWQHFFHIPLIACAIVSMLLIAGWVF